MPILFVNGKRRGLKIRGRARVNPARKGRIPSKVAKARFKAERESPEGKARLAAFWGATKNPARKRRVVRISARWGKKRKHRPGYLRLKRAKKPWRKRRKQSPAGQRRARKYHAALVAQGYRPRGAPSYVKARARRARAKSASKRGRRARRSTSMARRKRKKGQPAALKRYWAARKRAGKAGRPGKARRSSAARRRAALKGLRRAAGKLRRHPTRHAPPYRKKRRARRSQASAPRRKRRVTRRTRMSRKVRSARRPRSRRTSRRMTVLMGPPGSKTLRMNPSRRRRRKGGKHRARARRGHRRSLRRYRRGYRRNPGNMLLDLAKRALPVLAAFYGTRFLVNRIGPMLPGVSALGTLAGPALAVGSLFLTKLGAKHIAPMAKHKEELMLGAGVAVLDSLIQAFAPASVKALVGMSDYVQMGDYIAVGAVQPINDSMTLSDYIAVGSDGLQEELGLEEELGVEEELGNDLLGGVSSTSLMKRVPTQQFLAPVPARSFTRQIPAAGSAYDAPDKLYGGIFNGGF